MPHYYCPGGCGGTAEQHDVCKSENCPKRGQSFEECDCGDKESHKKMEGGSTEHTGGTESESSDSEEGGENQPQ